MDSYDLGNLLHIAAIISARPCECEGDCDTCAPCLARAELGVEEPSALGTATDSLSHLREDLS